MLPVISEKSKQGFEAAANKLNLSTQLPDLSSLRPDLALYLTAHYMLAVIVESRKDGKIYDITDHSVRKYEPYFYAKNGYIPGSSGGGFSSFGYNFDRVFAYVGARLSSNSWDVSKEIAEEFIDLWEIIILYCI